MAAAGFSPRTRIASTNVEETNCHSIDQIPRRRDRDHYTPVPQHHHRTAPPRTMPSTNDSHRALSVALLAQARVQLAYQSSSASSSSSAASTASIDARLDHALASSTALLAQARKQLAYQPSSTDIGDKL
ncbi:hypothetical protein B0A54_17481 [Friedmanniomyces endolithicus]|uniref:Uncharacterized protein n=1 Tax=Friedmanniomyces endolithicus TaxID=329885 RepID=A0A4U0TRZ6_9PEZI|nr:hypothetical protein B0A54_17481 [Friedmanniomyces endolithicus]